MSKPIIIITALLMVFPAVIQAADPVSASQKKTPNAPPPVQRVSSLAAGMRFIGKAVEEPDYYVWCTSPIMGDDGNVHLFCSRWPKSCGMLGWTTHSEIAHYVGKKPEGPFAFSEIAIPSNPGAPWNNSVHNPAIAKAGDKYVLLYITFDHRPGSPYRKNEKLPLGNMFTCMAIADSLNGPWKKLGEDGQVTFPSLDPKHWTYGSRSMDNPTFLAHGGKYYIYFKRMGAVMFKDVHYGYAVSDKLEGPYQLADAPCTDNFSYIEDATAFVWDGKPCLLMNDNFGDHTGIAGGGILWKSDTPTDFKLKNAEIGFLRTSDYCGNIDISKARKVYGQWFKFERPGLLMVDGKPAYFYGPSGVNLEGGDHTVSYVMKIDPEHPVAAIRRSLTYHAKATSSSVASPDYRPEKAVDGYDSTRWLAAPEARAGWLEVDLGGQRKVASARIELPLNRDIPVPQIIRYEVQVQEPDGSWRSIFQGKELSDPTDLYFQEPVWGRKFRLAILEAAGAPTIAEFHLWEAQ